jgi:hypothetical protein
MRSLLLLALAACASTTPAPTPTPMASATLHTAPSDARSRVVALLTREGIPIAANDGVVITTAPVDRLDLSGGTGASRVTGSVEYFIRATVTGDSVSTVTLTPWSRALVPNRPPREQPVPATCSGTTKCAAMHERVRSLIAALTL